VIPRALRHPLMRAVAILGFVAAADVLDWLITRSDRSEQGNFVGKFLDAYQP
jgi:hypothetical protein